MKYRICTLSKNDLKDLVKTYRIPLDLHPRLPDHGFTMDRLHVDAIGIYSEFLWFSGIRVPFSTFLLSVLKYFKVHISQLVPLGLNKVVSFEVVCRDLNIVPTVTLFRVFQCLCKQGDWFSFSKRRNTKDVCMDDGPSSQKKWKDKFFLIDRRAILNYLTWRHSCSWVSDDIPSDECDPVFRRIDDNAEISIYDFMTLPSWSDAKIVEESHHLSLPLLERVPLHTTAPTSEDAIIPLPTPDEIVASLPDSRLVKKLKGHSQASRPSKRRKLQKRASEAGSSALEDEGVSMRVASAPIPRLGKRLGAPHSIVVTSVSEPSHVGTSALTSTSGHSLSLRGAVTSGRIPDDDFGTATHGEEIDLTLFPLAPSPYHMPYPYEGVSSPLYTREEWNGRHALESELKLSNRVNVLSALLVSHGYELNSRYANLVSSKAHLQEKFDKKKGDVKLLRSDVTSLDSKLENLQRDYDALGQENRELQELTRTDAKLSEQALTVRDLQNELVLEKSKSQEYKDVMDVLREEADFDKALDDFPTTPFPFLSKIVAASEGSLSDVSQILPDKFVRSATSVAAAPSSANEAPKQVPP
ncbi:hypothetical protein Tco_1074099 [Tanacetum coccineum]